VPGEPGWLAITLKHGGLLVGGMGLQRWPPDEDTPWFVPEEPDDAPKKDPQVIEVELAYVLGREHWGRGYATEAALAVRDFALGELGLTRLISLIQQGNAASIRVAEKLGERLEQRHLHGFSRPTDLYALQR
jgi:RimJ/RimL family protein N-acetyltransferase